MGKTRCIGCNKSLGGVLDGFGTRLMAGDVCLTCKKKIKVIPGYQLLSAQQIRDIVEGKMLPTDPGAVPMPPQQQYANTYSEPRAYITPSYDPVQSVPTQTMPPQGAPMQQPSSPTMIPLMVPAAASIADELREYKALLDDGTLSEDEFKEIKRRLLNL